MNSLDKEETRQGLQGTEAPVRDFNFENSSHNLETIAMTVNQERATRELTLRERLTRDRDVLLNKRREIDEKVQRINGLIDDIDREPVLAGRYNELLIAVMSDKFKPHARI